jgi:hypothetical protein
MAKPGYTTLCAFVGAPKRAIVKEASPPTQPMGSRQGCNAGHRRGSYTRGGAIDDDPLRSVTASPAPSR